MKTIEPYMVFSKVYYLAFDFCSENNAYMCITIQMYINMPQGILKNFLKDVS